MDLKQREYSIVLKLLRALIKSEYIVTFKNGLDVLSMILQQSSFQNSNLFRFLIELAERGDVVRLDPGDGEAGGVLGGSCDVQSCRLETRV